MRREHTPGSREMGSFRKGIVRTVGLVAVGGAVYFGIGAYHDWHNLSASTGQTEVQTPVTHPNIVNDSPPHLLDSALQEAALESLGALASGAVAAASARMLWVGRHRP